MSDLPKQVKIGAVIWTLEENQDDLEDDENWGDTLPKRLRLRIRRETHVSKKRETLLHELFHGCNYSVLTGADQMNERQIKAISHSLMAVFADNPAILEFLGDG